MKNEFRHFHDVRTGEEKHEAILRSHLVDSNLFYGIIAFDHDFDTNRIVLSGVSRFIDGYSNTLLCFEI